MPTLNMVLNGKEVSVDVEPGDLLVHVLRDKLGQIGTKLSCGEGECGACTVLVDGLAMTSCIYPALKAQGRRVTTIEGLSEGRALHPIQQAFVDATAPQCGYCIPGMVMSAKALLDHNPHPSEEEIKEGLSGNICRCTGYYQIVEAVKLAAERMAGEGGTQ
ncbi:MAG TPA: (2Fe-2S)-binding protein [Chloroflexi bacterium]|nr:(2Fe-2S)-binding protein [Chloroflexota bacterium]